MDTHVQSVWRNRHLILAFFVLAFQIAIYSLIIDNVCIKSMGDMTNAFIFNWITKQLIAQLLFLS